MIRILSDEPRKEKENDDNVMDKPRKICVICKVYLIEKIKDVYQCPVCKAIVNERLDDREWLNTEEKK